MKSSIFDSSGAGDFKEGVEDSEEELKEEGEGGEAGVGVVMGGVMDGVALGAIFSSRKAVLALIQLATAIPKHVF